MDLENYLRLFDPLYGAIFLRSSWLAAVATALMHLARDSRSRCSSRDRNAQESVLESGDPAVLDQLSDPPVRLDVPAARYRFDQYGSPVVGTDPRALPLLYNEGAVLLGLVYGYLPFAVLPIYATLERQDQRAARSRGRSRARRPERAVRASRFRCARRELGRCDSWYLCRAWARTSCRICWAAARPILIGNLVQNQFTTSRDWPFGAAASIVLMIVAIAAAVR